MALTSTRMSAIATIVSAAAIVSLTTPAMAGGKGKPDPKREPLVLTETGNRTFGGKTVGDPRVGLLACDHGYIDWAFPPNPRKVPLVFIHASSKRTWLTSFDLKRDGFV